MTPERYRYLGELFDQARGLPPAQRAAFLQQVCADDLSLREELERLLAHHEHAQGEVLWQLPCPVNAKALLAEEEAPTLPGPSLAPVPEDALVGQRVGPYLVEQRLGHGGMGTVYRARREDSYRQQVAIKVIRPGLDTEELLHRFRTERQVLADLQHAHIARLLDGGSTEDGRPFFVMEYIDGEPLDRYCEGRQLGTRERLRLLLAVCAAVHHAHERGVVHRDLKPGNVLVTADGTAKVTDFGLAKRLEGGDGGAGPTQSGAVLGTPSYMASEQAAGKGKAVGPATDVYAVGAILYELLTGRPPFRADTPLDTLLQVLEAEPVPPGRFHPKLPRDLETICLKCLQKDPARRYASAAELADDLRRFLDGEPIRARPVGRAERLWRWCRRRPAAAALLALAILLPHGAAALGLWHWDAHYRVKVEYYADSVKRWGIPEGLGRVSEAEARHRHVTYRFYRRGGRVERVEAVNGLGALTTGSGMGAALAEPSPRNPGMGARGENRWEYSRDEQGEVTQEVARDRAGGLAWIFHYTTRTTGQFTDETGFPRPRAGSGAAYVEFTRSEDGLDQEIRYLDRNGKRKPDRDGVAGKRWEHDRRGRIVAETYLGLRGQPVRNRDGYSRLQRAYDDRGNPIEQTFFGPDGRPTLSNAGCARIAFDYDPYGNAIRARAFDAGGNPVPVWDGITEWKMVYDDHGNPIEWAYFGPDNKPALNRDGIAGKRFERDGRGDQVAWTNVGLDGKPAVGNRSGVARCTQAYDDHGNLLEFAYFGLDAKPAMIQHSFARCTLAYDERGNQIEQAWWDVDGKPWVDPWGGFAKETMKYDEHDNRTEVAYFGADSQPALHKSAGFAWSTFAFDDRGNVTERAYLGVDGRPALDRRGVARVTRAYDENGNLVEESFFGTDGKSTPGNLGYVRASFTFDPDGNHTGSTYFGADGKPVRTRVVVKDTLTPAFAEQLPLDLKPGDVLVAYEGQEVTCARLFVSRWRTQVPGPQPRELHVLRDGKPLTLSVPAGLGEWVWDSLETHSLPEGR
jgi:tRNA A-37 threonylcarbamoyl transferase component Bud32